ncbi:MAG: hypothetical protein WAV32_02145 [Halobacteriota archaeon]
MRREHPNWGKKRIAQWLWKEHGWERVVAIETVRNVLDRHGLWKRLSQHTMMLRIKGWMDGLSPDEYERRLMCAASG